jgi:hypothetical protein
MVRTRLILFVWTMFLAPAACFAQTVSGIVIDADTQTGLSKVSIQTSHSGSHLTDESGNFRIGFSHGMERDTLVITHVGYKQERLPVSGLMGKGRTIINLRQDIMMLPEVIVRSEFWRRQYSPREMKEDYAKFCSIMEKVHTGLYDYFPEDQWKKYKDSVDLLISEPMSHSRFYRIIALQVSKVRNAHTKHGVTDWWYRQKQNIFPFNVRFFGDRLFVKESLVTDLQVARGTEILSVNGKSPAVMKSMILPFIAGDGYIQTGRVAQLNDYFPWFFSLFVEEANGFEIEIRKMDGERSVLRIPGLRDSFAHLSFQQVQRWKKTSLELQIYQNLHAAWFRIEDSHAFKDSLAIYLERIKRAEVSHLILDLRGSGGIREEEQTAELLSHLVDKPFTWCDRIEVKSNDHTLFDGDFTPKPYARSGKQIKEQFYDRLTPTEAGYYLWQRESYQGQQSPAAPYYSGKIYILTDGRNYSASTDFTSSAAELENVRVIGEETGGEYRSYVSGAMYGLVLPNSKIGVRIATWKSTLSIPERKENRGRGVMPDYPVTESIEDFIQGKDVVKEFALELIRQSR